jgi:hypothetical protein
VFQQLLPKVGGKKVEFRTASRGEGPPSQESRSTFE